MKQLLVWIKKLSAPLSNKNKNEATTERPTSKIRGAIFLENRISVSIKTLD